MTSSVIVLNWNGWRDTIECLESLFHLQSSAFRVIVCDNASMDGSLENIKKWARGDLAFKGANPVLDRFTAPACRKPISYCELDRSMATSEGTLAQTEPLILIQNGANLGFAGGNNVGLRYALRDPDCQFFWLLNNDTVVEPDSLSAIIRRFESERDLGLCGSLSRSYYAPSEVQVRGGRGLRRWTGRTYKSNAHNGLNVIDYVDGSSMVATRAFLDRVGLLEESYFLYFEELDWAMRAKGKLALGYAPDSVIYHKEGASIGSNPEPGKRSLLSEQYLSRSRMLFMRRFFPWALPTVLASLLMAAACHLLRGDAARAGTIVVWSAKGLVARKTNSRSKG
jgi:GT2 family glycosyltransferase